MYKIIVLLNMKLYNSYGTLICSNDFRKSILVAAVLLVHDIISIFFNYETTRLNNVNDETLAKYTLCLRLPTTLRWAWVRTAKPNA